MPSLKVELEPGKTVHVKLVKEGYYTLEFDYNVPPAAATVTKTMYRERGWLSVSTTPTAATVKVDDMTKTSPAKFSLPTGTYTVEISKPGYETITDSVTIETDKTVTKSYTLTLVKGTLSVSTTPTGATVKVDTETKKSPCSFTLAPGTYTVTVSKPGYKTITDSVTITSGETTTKSYTLVLSKVTITFDTRDEDGTVLTGVEVWIDGEKKGTT